MAEKSDYALVNQVAMPQCAQMPIFQIRIINEHFDQSVDLEEPDITIARRKAIATAISIAADTVSEGDRCFGAEVTISQDEILMCRQVVSVSVSSLKH